MNKDIKLRRRLRGKLKSGDEMKDEEGLSTNNSEKKVWTEKRGAKNIVKKKKENE